MSEELRYFIVDCILGEWRYRIVDRKTNNCIAVCAVPEEVNMIVGALNENEAKEFVRSMP
jgi:hypothetical protein